MATRSFHTYGVAGDFSVNVATTPLCQAMDEVRQEMMGGLGGVGGYGDGAAHFDNRNYRCSYNICGRVISGGCTGNPKGTRKPGFGTPLGAPSVADDTSDTPYSSPKVDEYNKNRVGGNGLMYWLRWLLRTLTFGLIK